MGPTQIVGLLHLGLSVVAAFFFLVPKSRFDFLFLGYLYSAMFSWTLLSGACLFSYLVRPAGNTSIDTDDIYSVFRRQDTKYVKILLKAVIAFQILSVVIIARRNGLNPIIIMLPFIYGVLVFLRNKAIDAVFACIFPFYIAYCAFRFIQQ